MIERELDGHRVIVAVHGTEVVEEDGVDVAAFGEPAALGVQRVDLRPGPRREVVFVMARLDEVDRDVRARVGRARDRLLAGRASADP